jgi:hypothetical protein
MRRTVALLLLLAAGCATGGCGKHMYSRRDLDVDMSRHHLDLRWGRLGEAGQRVHPDMRAAFLQDWSTRGATVDLQDIEIVGVSEVMDGDAADVVLKLIYVDKATMQVQQATVVERWARTEEGWRVVRPIDLTAGTTAAPETPSLGGIDGTAVDGAGPMDGVATP